MPGTSYVGHRFGSYEIVALLGVGGMGEVYRAEDTTLGRQVAIKLLPEFWLSDPDRHARFDREARLLASLNHPNIGSIYGVAESDGVRALVLELVEGDTLADRIAAAPGGLPLDEVLTIGRQVAEALEAAHDRGIVHRDLKPANIKITPEGRVKVLDFGLAKALGAGETGSELSHSPTITVAGTRDGVLLGTAPYMSPEQARGKVVDKRADIWAFGCVLYEMLTGARAFDGRDVTEALASVIRGEPDWRALPADTPAALHTYLRRCLYKEQRERIRDIGDVRLALEGAFDVSPTAPAVRSGISFTTATLAVAVALATGAGIATLMGRVGNQPAVTDAPELRLQVVTRPGSDAYSFALSPDGLSLAYVAPGDAAARPPQLWLRALERGEERALAGTEGAEFPFWSPDGQSVGFFAAGSLHRLDLASGIVRTLAPAPQPRRGAWHPDGTIVFGPASVGPLRRVSADGGTVTEATALLPGQSNHRWPVFIPGTRQFLLFALGTRDARLYRGSLDSTTVERVAIDVDSEVAFVSPTDILFARQGALWTQRLDADRRGAEGDMTPIASAFLMDGTTTGRSALSASATGSFVYRSADAAKQLTLLDRTGRETGVVGPADAAQMILEAVSPDGRTLALSRTVSGNADVWLMDRLRGEVRRITTHEAVDGASVFSPDSRRLVYMSDLRADVWDMYEIATDGTGEPRLLLESGEQKNSQDWSRDGRHILYMSQSPKTGWDVWALPLVGNRQPFSVATTAFNEFSARFSPDGRWVSFSADDSGRMEVYVQSFPARGPRMLVSAGEGRNARWRSDGRELFYLAPGNRMQTVEVDTSGPQIIVGVRRPLFEVPWPFGQFHPLPGGQQFLFDRTIGDPPPLTMVLNWKRPTPPRAPR